MTILGALFKAGWPFCYGWGGVTFLWLVGCISVQVEPLGESLPRAADRAAVQWLEHQPIEPHIRVARLVATSQYRCEEALRMSLLSHARELGADAVVLEQVEVWSSSGPGPVFQPTTSPVIDVISPFWGGTWSPYYSGAEPWGYIQGPYDRRDWTLMVSGIAVRYVGVECSQTAWSQPKPAGSSFRPREAAVLLSW